MSYIILANTRPQVLLASSQLSDHEVIVHEGNWYFHLHQVDMRHLVKVERQWICPRIGIGYWYDLKTPYISIQNVAWVYDNPNDGYDAIAGRIGFWGKNTVATIVQQT